MAVVLRRVCDFPGVLGVPGARIGDPALPVPKPKEGVTTGPNVLRYSVPPRCRNIYAVAGDTRLVKIGIATDLRARLVAAHMAASVRLKLHDSIVVSFRAAHGIERWGAGPLFNKGVAPRLIKKSFSIFHKNS